MVFFPVDISRFIRGRWQRTICRVDDCVSFVHFPDGALRPVSSVSHRLSTANVIDRFHCWFLIRSIIDSFVFLSFFRFFD